MIRGTPKEKYENTYLGLSIASLPMIALGPPGIFAWLGATFVNGMLTTDFIKKE